MKTPLHDVLRGRLKLSDAEFAVLAGLGQTRASGRTHVWKLRKGKLVPDIETAEKVLSALQKLGVKMTLAELLRRPRKTKNAA